MKENFLNAIDNKLKIRVTFDAKEKGQITRICIPFDFGPSQKVYTIDKTDKYHMLDLDSPDGRHNLGLIESQINSIEVLDETFDPSEYVKWQPKWIYQRDWGDKS